MRSDPNQPVASVPSATKQEIVNSEIQILTSRDLTIAMVADKSGRKSSTPAQRQPAEAAVRSFQTDFKASPVEHSDVIDVTYRNRDRDVAVQALNILVELYQQKHAEMFSDPRYKFLEQQTSQYEDQLERGRPRRSRQVRTDTIAVRCRYRSAPSCSTTAPR